MMRHGTLANNQILQIEDLILKFISILKERFSDWTQIVDALKSHQLIYHYLVQVRKTSLSGECGDQGIECKHTHEKHVLPMTRSLSNRPVQQFRLECDYLRVMEDPKYLEED